MRLLGIDVGRRRIGLAVSDPAGILATPRATLTVGGPVVAGVVAVVREVDALRTQSDGLAGVVVGLPLSLDGRPHRETGRVRTFVELLRARVALPVHLQDERLTSREAESRLAVTERAWRRRKGRLDATAAAIILQDYLDSTRVEPQPASGGPP